MLLKYIYINYRILKGAILHNGCLHLAAYPQFPTSVLLNAGLVTGGVSYLQVLPAKLKQFVVCPHDVLVVSSPPTDCNLQALTVATIELKVWRKTANHAVKYIHYTFLLPEWSIGEMRESQNSNGGRESSQNGADCGR